MEATTSEFQEEELDDLYLDLDDEGVPLTNL